MNKYKNNQFSTSTLPMQKKKITTVLEKNQLKKEGDLKLKNLFQTKQNFLNLKEKLFSNYKKKKKKSSYGRIYLKVSRRNAYFSLINAAGHLKASLSAGYLKTKGKATKGKARRNVYFAKKLAQRFVELILDSKIQRFVLILQGYTLRRIKKIYIKAFKAQKKKFKFRKFTRLRKTPHNGCRPRKIRRK